MPRKSYRPGPRRKPHTPAVPGSTQPTERGSGEHLPLIFPQKTQPQAGPELTTGKGPARRRRTIGATDCSS